MPPLEKVCSRHGTIGMRFRSVWSLIVAAAVRNYTASNERSCLPVVLIIVGS